MSRRFGTRGRRGGDWSGGGLILPPQPANLIGFWEYDNGVTNTAGEASAWAPRPPGTLSITGASGERPDIVSGTIPNLLRFNGTTDRMTFAARGSLTKATFAAWVKIPGATVGLNDTVFSTADLSAGYLLVGTGQGGGPSNAERWVITLNGATNGTMQASADGQIHKDTWLFIAVVYDGTQGTQNARCHVYYREHGQTVFSEGPQLAGGTIPASLTAGGASGALCDLVGFSRQLPCDMSAAYWYEGAALTTAELMLLSNRRDPMVGKKSVMALGDSITLGTGDTAGFGGWRSDILSRAGSQEKWSYSGSIINGTSDANNRCQAVGGKKIEEIQANFTADVALGWDPQIVICTAGRNNISAGDSAATIGTKAAALFTALSPRRVIFHLIPDTSPTDSPLSANANAQITSAAASFPNVTIVSSAAVGNFDGVHPDHSGYVLMGAAIWAALSPLVV